MFLLPLTLQVSTKDVIESTYVYIFAISATMFAYQVCHHAVVRNIYSLCQPFLVCLHVRDCVIASSSLSCILKGHCVVSDSVSMFMQWKVALIYITIALSTINMLLVAYITISMGLCQNRFSILAFDEKSNFTRRKLRNVQQLEGK
jgi:hypothetical protein